MDKFLILLEDLKESENILLNRRSKKVLELKEKRQENQFIKNKTNKLNLQTIELCNIRNIDNDVNDVITNWNNNDSKKVKKSIITYGIVTILTTIISLGLYMLLPEAISILTYSVIAVSIINNIAVLLTALMPIIKTLIVITKNANVIKNNDIDEVNKKITKNIKKRKKLEKQYERNEIKINNLIEKIEILDNAINDLTVARYSVEVERTRIMSSEFTDNQFYTEEAIKNRLNAVYDDSDTIKRVRIKEREIKNDN